MVDRPTASAAVATVVIVGTVTLAFATLLPRADVAQPPTPRPSSTLGAGPLPAALLHAWARPVPTGAENWSSGDLDISDGQMTFSALDGPVSSGSIQVTGADSFAVTNTVEMSSCAAADSGTYRWLLEGKDTVLTLTPIDADACTTRQDALAGRWVRADFPPGLGSTMPPGIHESTVFDPFGERSRSGALSYTVPQGWASMDDSVATFVIGRVVDGASGGQHPPTMMIAVLAQPRMANDVAGQACGPLGPQPGVGTSVDALAAEIRDRPGVVSTKPEEVSIGGYRGRLLDLEIAPGWKGGCVAPSEGVITSVPILVTASSSPAGGAVTAIGPDHPVRILLLDLGDSRSLAIVVFELEPSSRSQWQELVAEAMPVIESFEFRPAAP
jgi:hypothetical protein